MPGPGTLAAVAYGGPTVTAPPATPPTTGFRSGLAVLRHRDYSVMLVGQFVSNTGVWMHNVTVPFVLFAATGSAVWVGLGGFAQFFPAMVMAPIGGVLADRFPRRAVLAVVSLFQMAAALVLAAIWRGGDGSPGATIAVVALLGILSGLALPSWQSLVPLLVPREWLVRAVSLNSTVFNGARAFGPAVGGLLLAEFGPATAFAVNGFSYLGVFLAVALVRARQRFAIGGHERPLDSVRTGFAYARSHSGIVLAWVLAFSGASLGAPVMGLSAVMAAEEFNVDASRYGLLTAAVGLGAACGGLLITAYAYPVARSKLAGFAISLYGGAVLAFALSPTYTVGLVAMLFVGFGLLATNTTLNTSIQLKVDDEFRGRVMSTWAMAITGGLPTGALIQGWLASRIGVRPTIAMAGIALVTVVTIVRLTGRIVRLDPN